MAAGTVDASGSVNRYILLSDIASSSRLAEAYPQEYYTALEAHNSIIEGAVKQHQGEILKNLGDGYLALFDDAAGALAAAVTAQLAFSGGQRNAIAAFPDGSTLGVRTVVHGGRLTRLSGQEQDWFGPALNRCSRIGNVCHPGQLLISGVVRAALTAIPPELTELDLGRVRLRDLGEPEQLIQLTHHGFAQRQFPPLRGLDARPNNLAVQPNTFIGRDKELAQLARMLSSDTRLLTLHAHGGYGKSRLASQLCAHMLWRFEHGAYEVLLAPVRDHRYLPEAIADATGFQFYGKRKPKEQVLDYLRQKDMLLCLDNFEHLLEGAEFIAEILKAAPQVRILVTSREPLRLSAERVYSVEPLPLGPGSDSVQLFVDRANRVRHGFRLDEENSPAVERLCERLEGIPLALELAAAWAGEFTLKEMYAELGRQVELAARLADVPQRQRSVRASCDWSYGLLQPALQRALCMLAVFHGGFFVDAAEAVLEQQGLELRRMLSALTDKSWLITREVNGQTRFFIRDAASHEYALEKLREAGRACILPVSIEGGQDARPTMLRPAIEARRSTTSLQQDNIAKLAALAPDTAHGSAPTQSLCEQASLAHARYFSSLMEREGPRLHGHGQLEALRTIKLELQNIYEAQDALQQRLLGPVFSHPAKGGNRLPLPADLLLPIAAWLWEYLDKVSEFSTMLERYQALKHATGTAGALPQILLWAFLGCGRGQFQLSAYEAARVELGGAKALAEALGDRNSFALGLSNLGNAEFWQGNHSVAHKLYAEAIAIQRETGDSYGIAESLLSLGRMAYTQGNYSFARELFSEALSISREMGDRHGTGYSLNNLGNVEYFQGNYGTAGKLYAEALAIQRETGDRRGIAVSVNNQGNVEYIQGNYGAARVYYSEGLAITREIGNRLGIAYSLHNLGVMDYMQGNYGAAQELFTEALAIQVETGDRYGIAESLNSLGNVEFTQGNYSAAQVHYADTLAITREIDHQPGLCESLSSAGCLLAANRQYPAAAICLYGAQYHAAQLGYTFQPMERGLQEQGLALIDGAGVSACGPLPAGVYARPTGEAGEQDTRLTGLTVDERARLHAQAEAMSLGELAQYALHALEQLKGMLDASAQQAHA